MHYKYLKNNLRTFVDSCALPRPVLPQGFSFLPCPAVFHPHPAEKIKEAIANLNWWILGKVQGGGGGCLENGIKSNHKQI